MKALSQQTLLDIVAAASTIDERLAKKFLPNDEQTNEMVVKTRLDEWCQNVAKGDWEQFRRRLAWDNLDEDMVRQILGAVRVPEGTLLPTWADTLSKTMNLTASLPVDEAGASQVNGSCLPFLDVKEPFPFEELLVPFVLLAQWRCIAQAGDDAFHLLCDEAFASLQRSLLQSLTAYAAQALYLEFSIERATEQSSLERLLVLAEEDEGRFHYQQFVERMRQGGLAAFFQEYTVLARLLATITDLWVEATVEFLQRLAADWPDIQQMFGGERELGRVAILQPSLSDPHRGRRRVIALTFTSGHRLVYKPKDLSTELSYYQLLDWCNERGTPLTFKVLKVINRSSHGWVEFVEHEPCQDWIQARRYYQRAGMLLCLVYVLEGTDCHYENIIACGEHPVLVDMETLMHHRPRLDEEGEEGSAELHAYEQMAHSVLRTGLLPTWQVRNNVRDAYDVSGLGGEQELLVSFPRWMHINTDRMTLEYGSVLMQGKENMPMLDGAILRLEEHSPDVVEGFRQMYRFLLNQREALLAAESPLYELAHQQVRFIYRATRTYGSIAQDLHTPIYLRDGAERSIRLERLGRIALPLEGPLHDKGEPSRWWTIFKAERQAMEQADTPFFTARANSDALIVASGQEVEACFQEPSFDQVVARLKTLSDEDLEQQVGFISGSLYTYVARDIARVSAFKGVEVSAGFNTGGMPTAEGLVTQALAIAQQITARAIRGEDGSVAWIAPQYLVNAKRYQLQPLGYDLYSGTCGVALFLAAVEKVVGGTNYRKLAMGALQPLRQALRNYGQRTARDMGIGGASGLGSVVYVLTRMSQWLDEPVLLEDAKRAASLITAERIAGDTALDIITGVAGGMLGLLALYEVVADQKVLEQVLACGQHLLRTRTQSEMGYRSWPTLDKKLLTGFSHGAAGISYALLRLYAITHNEALFAAAQEAIAYEDSVFASGVENWPDFRAEEQPTFMTSWCHGAPGIGLARIGGLSVLDTTCIRRDIEVALSTTQRFGIQGPDHLCCGNLGRADILLVAASRLAHPELAMFASRQAWHVVTKASQTGRFLLHPQLPVGVYSPGFFQGMAGVGYTLLRLAQPDGLPSVLLWQ